MSQTSEFAKILQKKINSQNSFTINEPKKRSTTVVDFAYEYTLTFTIRNNSTYDSKKAHHHYYQKRIKTPTRKKEFKKPPPISEPSLGIDQLNNKELEAYFLLDNFKPGYLGELFTEKQLKKYFRSLALKLHPDTNQGDSHMDFFKMHQSYKLLLCKFQK